MTRFFENKFAFLAVFTMFAIPFVWNLSHGSASLLNGHGLMRPDIEMTAHGSSIPPDPDMGLLLAHGSSIPPDPDMEFLLAHGSSIPPDPDMGFLLAHRAS